MSNLLESKLPIVAVIAIVMQIAGFSWWIGQQAQTIDELKNKVALLTGENKITQNVNLQRDVLSLQARLDRVESDLRELEQEFDDDLDEAVEDISKVLFTHDHN